MSYDKGTDYHAKALFGTSSALPCDLIFPHFRYSSGTTTYLTCANVFAWLGDVGQSQAVVEAGYKTLMTEAEKISDPQWRTSFLENVSENKAIAVM